MVRVKICGLQSERDIEISVAAGADAVGFIFAESRRRVSVRTARRLSRRVPPFVTCVGVFAHNSAASIVSAIEHCRLDVLQFSAGEPAGFCGSFGKPTIVVTHAGARSLPPTPSDLATARAIATMVDATNGERHGGSGTPVPLDLAARMRMTSSLPFVLAGGLRPDNVAQAIACVRPWAVDVCSGVEREGRKDPILIDDFIRAARAASNGEQ
ncbi:MAG: phosphoribosylanthranilate isomerase [Candidatus Eremiobacteraeota bacterium]|nr:phosphoribosylanthranilate isomerase [Candidatus Eremiobacteraeota bacterium]